MKNKWMERYGEMGWEELISEVMFPLMVRVRNS